MEIKRKDPPQPHSKELKVLTTAAVLLGNITFNCAVNLYAPSLEELRSKYDTTIDKISVFFTIIGVSFCGGALASGFMYTWINRQVATIICLGGIACTTIISPLCPTKTLLFVNGGFLGFFIGIYDTAQVVWVMEIWQSKSGPYIQAQHFCFALGSNLGPLLMAPFLSNKKRDLVNIAIADDNSTSILNLGSNNPENENYDPYKIEPDETESSRIYIPFAIAGILNVISMCYQIFLFVFYRYYTPPLEETLQAESQDSPNAIFLTNKKSDFEKENSSSESSLNQTQKPHEIEPIKTPKTADGAESENLIKLTWPRIRLITISSIFLAALSAMEVSTIQFIPTFGQYSDLKLSESESAFVLSGLTGAYAIGRAMGICIVLKVPPLGMMFANFSLIIVGNCILLLWASWNVQMFWAGCILLGVGFSTVFASFCAFMERHLIMTNGIASCWVVTASVFVSTYPLFVGKFVAENAVVLTYSNFFSITICLISLSLGILVTRKSSKRV